MTFPVGPSSDKDISRLGTLTPNQSDAVHARSDTDVSQQSKHHTLGAATNQAAPGSHMHDGGTTSPKLGFYTLDNATGAKTPSLVLTGAKGSNAALASVIALLKNFIDFTDNTTA